MKFMKKRESHIFTEYYITLIHKDVRDLPGVLFRRRTDDHVSLFVLHLMPPQAGGCPPVVRIHYTTE